MYKIYAEEMAVTASKLCIYHDAENLESICLPDPKLTMEDNSAGQLTLTMPPANAGYDSVNRLTTTLTVYKDDVEIWSGRVISEDMDFWNQRSLTCEGELAYLNDSIQPPEEYHIESTVCVEQFLIDLIAIHNAQVEDYKKFKVGTVTVHDSNGYLYKYTNYNTTWDCIQEKLLDTYGGHLVITKGSNGRRTLNYYDNYPGTSTQRIEFGKNLLDFTKSWDMTDFATVILPRGAQLEQEVEYDGEGNVVNSTEYIEALVPYTNLEDYSATSGSIVTRIYSGDDAYLGQYVINTEAVANYGWISVVVDWSDVTEKGNLWNKAVAYLEDIQFDDLQLEINAVDLHYLGADYDTINLLDQVVVLSRPHGLVGSEGTGKEFPVTKLDIPLNDPENATFTFGDKVNNTLTGSTRSTNSDILNRIESMKLPDVSSEAAKLLEEAISVAQENANNMIARATEGYITIVYDQDLRFPESRSQAIYISNDVDYTAASDFWVWNSGGLAHYHQGTANRIKDANGNWIDLPDVAINMDGSIYASYITAGVITADLITAGTLTNTTGTFYLNLNNNVLRLGPWTVNNSSFYYGSSSVTGTGSSGNPYIYMGTSGLNFSWGSEAYVRINDGMLSAFGADITTVSGSYYTQMVGGYLKFYYGSPSSSTNQVGGIRSTYWSPNGSNVKGLDISLESNGSVLCLGGVQKSGSSTYITPMVINQYGSGLKDSGGSSYSESVIIFESAYISTIRMSDVLRINITDSTSDWSAYAYYNTLPAIFNLSISGASVKYATSAGSADSATSATTADKLSGNSTITITNGSSSASGTLTNGTGSTSISISSLIPSYESYTHPMDIILDTVTLNKGLTVTASGYITLGSYSDTGAYSSTTFDSYAHESHYGRVYMYGNNWFGGSENRSDSGYTQYFYGYLHCYYGITMDAEAEANSRHITIHSANDKWQMFIGAATSSDANQDIIGFCHLLSSETEGTYFFYAKYDSSTFHSYLSGNQVHVGTITNCTRVEIGHNTGSSGTSSTATYIYGGTINIGYSVYDGTINIGHYASGYTQNTNIYGYTIYVGENSSYVANIYIYGASVRLGYNSLCTAVRVGHSSSSTYPCTVYILGSQYNTSDISLKSNIQELSLKSMTPLNIIDNITPISYIFTDGRQHYGYSANEVLDACGGEYGIVIRDDEDGYLMMSYNDLIPLLHLKIKQLESRINELETIIEEED